MASSSKSSKKIWIRKQKCPCGDIKCYIRYEDDAQTTTTTDSAISNQSQLTPYTGMKFKDDTEAFMYYTKFGWDNGFLVRKESSKIAPEGVATTCFFVCERAGTVKNPDKDARVGKCGCTARMNIRKVENAKVPHWTVTVFSNIHNHELLPDVMFNLLKRGNELKEEKASNPTIEILEACELMKEDDEEFVYNYTLDGTNKLERIAWSFGASVDAYNKFGDAVYFDTSYCSIRYRLIFGAWLGIDNYGRVLLFGCVLMKDRTFASIKWALQSFVHLMKGRHPQTIISEDLDPDLNATITLTLPFTQHVTSITSIMANIPSWFSLTLGTKYADFKSDFCSLYILESTENFQSQWQKFVSQYRLHGNKHIRLLYALRQSWTVSYTRGMFLAQMTTEAYSKSADTFLKKVFQGQTCLRYLLRQIKSSLGFESQASQDTDMRDLTYSHMEEHARSILTPFAFRIFHKELLLALQYYTHEKLDGSYLVSHGDKMDERNVIWIPEDEMLRCSCKEFESSAILCRHSLCVLKEKNYIHVPEKYCNRWQREMSLQ